MPRHFQRNASVSPKGQMKKKITATPAWAATVGATFDLIALIFMAGSNAGFKTMTALAACEVVLIVGAVAAWQKYVVDLIDERTRKE